MSWIRNHISNFCKARETGYNRNVCLNKQNLERMVAGFDSVWDGFVNFTEEVTSLMLYPFRIKTRENLDNDYTLQTTHFDRNDVEVYNIDFDAYYVTLGEYKVNPYFNNFADYKGYTEVRLFLPKVGFVDIDVNECMNKWLQFRLFIDFYTGKGMYIIGVSDNSISHRHHPYPFDHEDDDIRVISTFECALAIEIPLGTSNIGDIKRNLLMGTIKTGLSLASSIYTANLPPPTNITSSTTTYDIKGRSTAKGSRMKQIKSGSETTTRTSVTNKPVNAFKMVSDTVDSSIETLNRSFPGSSTDRVNDSGLMGSLTYEIKVVIYRPKIQPYSADYGKLYGFPCGKVLKLENVSGYTEINSIHFEGQGFETITQREIAMLEEKFCNGIIL